MVVTPGTCGQTLGLQQTQAANAPPVSAAVILSQLGVSLSAMYLVEREWGVLGPRRYPAVRPTPEQEFIAVPKLLG